jgi:LPS sulfotransferase NodH
VRSYILCATPRSGSTLLCALLRASGVAGWPESWFRAEDRAEWAAEWRVGPGFDPYLAGALAAGRGANGVFGLRLMWETLAELMGDLRAGTAEGSDLEHLVRAFGPLQFIHLRRGDLVAQAVSRHRAEMSGIWHLGIEEAENPVRPVYDVDRIRGFVDEARAGNAGWARWFADQGVTPLQLAYEDLAADPPGSAGLVLEFLGLTARQKLEAPNRRMADAESAAWVRRFRAEAGLSAD